MKKALAFIVISALAVIVTACSADAQQAEISDTSAPVTAAETEATDQWGRKIVTDSLPAGLDYEGLDFNLLLRESPWAYEFAAEEENGDIVNDAIFRRNQTVEERLNIKLNLLYGPLDFISMVKSSVMAGDNAYDMCAVYMYVGAKNATSGLFYNMLDIPHIDFDKTWWNQSFTEEMTLNGKLFFVMGDANFDAITGIYTMFYNADLVKDYIGGVDLYQTVYDGKWTIDYLREIISVCYADLNGDNSVGEDDFFGYGASTASLIDGYTFADADPVTTRNADGIPELTFGGDRTVAMVEKLYALLFETNGALGGYYTAESAVLMFNKFLNSELIFIMRSPGFAVSLRDFKQEYGILPVPKLYETDTHKTTPNDGCSLFAVISTCEKTDMVGAAMELFAAESYQQLIPQYYEVVMKVKYLRTDAASAMYDFILDSVGYNFGMVHTGSINHEVSIIRQLLADRSGDFMSAWEKNKKASQRNLDKLIEGYFAE